MLELKRNWVGSWEDIEGNLGSLLKKTVKKLKRNWRMMLARMLEGTGGTNPEGTVRESGKLLE